MRKKLQALADALPPAAVPVLEGRAMLLDGRFAVRPQGDGFTIHELSFDSSPHFVTRESCSCPDAKFRNRECKHLKAIRRLYEP